MRTLVLQWFNAPEVSMTEDAIADDLAGSHKAPPLAAFGALGVVYGDIGTSPLYALKQAVTAAQVGASSFDVAVVGAVRSSSGRSSCSSRSSTRSWSCGPTTAGKAASLPCWRSCEPGNHRRGPGALPC